MKRPFKVMYHSFTDGRDNWHDKLKEAKAQIKRWRDEGEENLRIYKEVYDTEEEFEEGGETDEDCIYAVGAWPQ